MPLFLTEFSVLHLTIEQLNSKGTYFFAKKGEANWKWNADCFCYVIKKLLIDSLGKISPLFFDNNLHFASAAAQKKLDNRVFYKTALACLGGRWGTLYGLCRVVQKLLHVAIWQPFAKRCKKLRSQLCTKCRSREGSSSSQTPMRQAELDYSGFAKKFNFLLMTFYDEWQTMKDRWNA